MITPMHYYQNESVLDGMREDIPQSRHLLDCPNKSIGMNVFLSSLDLKMKGSDWNVDAVNKGSSDLDIEKFKVKTSYQFGGKWKPRNWNNEDDTDLQLNIEGRIRRGGKVGKCLLEEEKSSANVFINTLKPSREEKCYKCEVCDKLFATQTLYKRHLQTKYHSKRENPVQLPTAKLECITCQKVFSNKYNLQYHMSSNYHAKRCKMSVNSEIIPPSDVSSIEKMIDRRRNFQCRLCDFTCSLAKDFQRHLRNQFHLQQIDRSYGPLMCVGCKFKFPKSENMKVVEDHLNGAAHKRLHKKRKCCVFRESGGLVKCQQCGKLELSIYNLRIHISRNHSNPNSYRETTPSNQCQLCNVKLSSAWAVKLHHMRKHSKHRPHACCDCSVQFADRYSFEKHCLTDKHLMNMQQHQNNPENTDEPLGMKPSNSNGQVLAAEPEKGNIESLQLLLVRKSLWRRCRICQAKFQSKTHFEEHVKAHSSQLLYCEHCGRGFMWRVSLRRHKLIHQMKPFRCQYQGCLQSFIYPSQLKEHSRIHSVGKFYRCTGCGYRCKTGSALAQHYRIHSRPNTCEFCSYRACSATNLRVHLRRHLGSNPFSCPHCSVKFNSLRAVQRHVTSQHPGCFVYLCQRCPFGSAKAFQLKDHLMTAHQLQPAQVAAISKLALLYDPFQDHSKPKEGEMVLQLKEN